MIKKRIKEVERLGSAEILFPATLEYAINELQKMQGKYGPKAQIDYDTEWDYDDYKNGFLSLTYIRDETDHEFEKRKKKSESAKKAKAKGDETKKANKMKRDKLTYNGLKHQYPDWFKRSG